LWLAASLLVADIADQLIDVAIGIQFKVFDEVLATRATDLAPTSGPFQSRAAVSFTWVGCA
jgi:hypothetical protein